MTTKEGIPVTGIARLKPATYCPKINNVKKSNGNFYFILKTFLNPTKLYKTGSFVGN